MEKLLSISRVRPFKGTQDGELMIELTLDFDSDKKGVVFCKRQDMDRTKERLLRYQGVDADWVLEPQASKFPSGDAKPCKAILLEVRE